MVTKESIPTRLADCLPDRPLEPGEVVALEGIGVVAEVVLIAYRREYPPVLSFIIVTDAAIYTLGWKPGGSDGWDLIYKEVIE